jgi:hypothetical protein
MKTGKSLGQLAQEIERQTATRRDYVAPTSQLEMKVQDVTGQPVALAIGDKDVVGINDLAHRQLGDQVEIPAKYYDRMRSTAPALLASNVNHWLQVNPDKRMVRTLDGRVRAWLSDRYRPLENADLAEAVLPVLAEQKLELVSCEITEKRLYIKAVDPAVVREVQGRRFVDGRQVSYDHISPSITGHLEFRGGHAGRCRSRPAPSPTSAATWRSSGRRSHAQVPHRRPPRDCRRAGRPASATGPASLTDAATWSQVVRRGARRLQPRGVRDDRSSSGCRA